MTPSELIAILKQANGEELAEIRSLLGVPMGYDLSERAFVWPLTPFQPMSRWDPAFPRIKTATQQ